VKFKALRDLKQVIKVKDFLRLRREPFSIDLETSGTDPRRDEIVGVGIGWSAEGAIYIPIKHAYDQPFDGDEALHILESFLVQASLITYNAVFDLEFLEHSAGILCRGECFDAGIMAYVNGVYPAMSLQAVADVECPEVQVKTYDEFMRSQELSKNKNSIAEAPIDAVTDYCGRDTLAAYLIYKKLYPKVKDNPVYKLEKAVFPANQWMRDSGVLIDKKFFKEEQERLDEGLENLHKLIQAQVSEVAGEQMEFNIGSYKQLGKVLYDILKLPCTDYTPTGDPKTAIKVLEVLKWKQPIVRNIITYKEISKRRTTYFKKYVSFIQNDGRIHASFNQTGVPSGRFSCSDPNLLNLPRKETWSAYVKGKKEPKIVCDIRKGFTVPEDSWLLEFDYSQIEARVAAGLTQDPVLLNTFRKGIDFHTQTASLIFNVPLESVTKSQRYLGKTLNFTLIYGAGTGELYRKLNEEMETSYETAKDFRNRYLSSYPRMFHGAEMVAKEAQGRGYVNTYFNRRVPIFGFDSPDKMERQKAARIAYNQVVQGTAADIAKYGMVKVTKLVKAKYSEFGIKLILFIYDSLSFEIPKKVNLLDFVTEGLQKLDYKIKDYPEFPVEVSIGKHWGALESPKEGENLEDFIKRVTSQTVEPKPIQARTFILAFPQVGDYDRAGIEKLKEFLKSKPGKNRIILRIGDVTETLPYTSGAGIEDKERIMLYTGGKFYEKIDD
jgi:DNA polymerase-1